jgi:hypothetical protein
MGRARIGQETNVHSGVGFPMWGEEEQSKVLCLETGAGG